MQTHHVTFYKLLPLLCGTQGLLTQSHILNLAYIPFPCALLYICLIVSSEPSCSHSLSACDVTVPSTQNSILLIHHLRSRKMCYLLLTASPIFPKAIPSLSSNKWFTSCSRGLCAYLPSLHPITQIPENKNYILFLSMFPSPCCLVECLAHILVHKKYLENCKIHWALRMDIGTFPVGIDPSVQRISGWTRTQEKILTHQREQRRHETFWHLVVHQLLDCSSVLFVNHLLSCSSMLPTSFCLILAEDLRGMVEKGESMAATLFCLCFGAREHFLDMLLHLHSCSGSFWTVPPSCVLFLLENVT